MDALGGTLLGDGELLLLTALACGLPIGFKKIFLGLHYIQTQLILQI
jgi:hypothetical protein